MKKNLGMILLGTVLGGAAALLLLRRPAPASSPAPAAAGHEATHENEPGALSLSPEAISRAGLRWAPAALAELAPGLTAPATVAANGAAIHHVRLLNRGRILSVLVKTGDTVRAGDPLVTYENLEINTFQSELLTARANLRKAESAAAVTANAVRRASNLLELGAVPQAELERRTGDHQAALAAVEVERAHVEKVSRLLVRSGVTPGDNSASPHSLLRSPFGGVVSELSAATGELRDPGEDILTLTDLASIWIVADVYERDLARVRPGQAVTARFDAYPGRAFSARIASIAEAVDPATRTLKVRCEAANPGGLLKLGLFGVLALPGGPARQAVIIPAEALQTVDGVPTVYLRLPDGRFLARAVEPGERDGSRQEIRAGLSTGETVVTAGAFALKAEAAKSRLHAHAEDEE